MANNSYKRTFTSFSGADILVSFGEKVIGELQSITYSVTREKAPIYTLGSANPRSFSRGKRGVAGSLVFQVFDRDAMYIMKQNEEVHRHGHNRTGRTHRNVNAGRNRANQVRAWEEPMKPHYSDEVMPFDVTITYMNEYGQRATLVINDVEILNEGMGMSIDDISIEKACTFVAREIQEMTPDQ